MSTDLAARVQQVRLLLETLNDPYPTPKIALVPDSGPAPSRYVPCQTCQKRGEVRVRGGWVLCLVCDGRGEKRREDEPEWDAYLGLPLAEAASLPRASTRPRLDDGRRDEAFGWERLLAAYDRHGSYAAVRRQLHWLALAQPRRYSLVRAVLVDHEPRVLSAGAQRDLELGVVAITLRIPTVRVPTWLVEQTRSDRRQATIQQLVSEGMTPGQVARKLGISKRAVQRQIRVRTS